MKETISLATTMGHNQEPVDGRHKKVWQQCDSNNKKAISNNNCFIVSPTWISYSYYSEDETFSSKAVDDQLENEDIETWQKVMAEMKELSSSVPKHTGGENPQLICFCDTSEKASAT